MERETHIDNEGNNTLLKGFVLALIVICFAVVAAVKGQGDSANFAGRARWLAIHILKTLPRVFSQTATSIFENKRRYNRIATMFEEVWNEIFGHKPNRRQGDEL